MSQDWLVSLEPVAPVCLLLSESCERKQTDTASASRITGTAAEKTSECSHHRTDALVFFVVSAALLVFSIHYLAHCPNCHCCFFLLFHHSMILFLSSFAFGSILFVLHRFDLSDQSLFHLLSFLVLLEHLNTSMVYLSLSQTKPRHLPCMLSRLLCLQHFCTHKLIILLQLGWQVLQSGCLSSKRHVFTLVSSIQVATCHSIPPAFIMDVHFIYHTCLSLTRSACGSLTDHFALLALSISAPKCAGSSAFSLPSVFNCILILHVLAAFTCKMGCNVSNCQLVSNRYVFFSSSRFLPLSPFAPSASFLVIP